jgi:hypothetical protein
MERRLGVQARNYIKQVAYISSSVSGGMGLTENTERLYRRFTVLIEEYDTLMQRPMMLPGSTKNALMVLCDGCLRIGIML